MIRSSRIALPLAGLLLAACATQGEFQYKREVGPSRLEQRASESGEVTVIWRFGNAAWVNSICGAGSTQVTVHGCAIRAPDSDKCIVFAVQPEHFDDAGRLAVLGHELWHCQGARHAS